ncbi:hypothetical protein WHR41_04621 [Cladosporium halotolerans]|uniref:Dynein light chain n=1 Tax=Cladosporium halotolerans TaxID=1052096 RepID=A0AB34KST1_9PEZI
MSSNFPITSTRLSQIASDACTSTLSSATAYAHDSTASWNNSIINKILQSLISESSSPYNDDSRYKFAVNSTIIQHLSDPREEGEKESDGAPKKVGRRGMHSASGAYWNNEQDGMWSYKFEGGEGKGMDVVVSVMWIGV